MAIRATHLDVVNRLKRRRGHLRTPIEMIDAQRECLDAAAACDRKAIHDAQLIHIHNHIDNRLEDIFGSTTRKARNSLVEFREIAEYL